MLLYCKKSCTATLTQNLQNGGAAWGFCTFGNYSYCGKLIIKF